ncbi:hypothetical protein [Paenibacillus donghaensis]|uniref:Phage portal protein n=1 Tax=Paenibacillus donghaensis TaxID=414771 RepID=A0A2Z2K833_9BACL|nr:hypothetical protein [Paenibacillus donghaensis]ASA22746.1 hypothetical protein B9T62_19255 [Paenibacillus donghaensis]
MTKATKKTTSLPTTSDEQTITPSTSQPIEQVNEEYALQFAQSMARAYQNSTLLSPLWQNELLKNLNMSPTVFSRDKIEELIKNPRANEDALKDLGQYLYNAVMQFNRLVNYYATLLTFDHFIVHTNADDEDVKSSAYKKSRKKAVECLDKIVPKLTFPNILRGVILEDAKFYYIREFGESIAFQEMPSKYCKIVDKTEYGYQYAFNMYYFLQSGVDINSFAPEFLGFLEDFKNDKNKKNIHHYWQPLDPIKAPVFKFDETRAGLTPPLMGLFLDSAEIDQYKKLLKTKTELETWKIIVGKIPMKQDNKGAVVANNFAIDPIVAGQYTAILQAGVPTGVKVATTPFELDTVDFSQSQSQNNIIGYGQENFYNSAGSTPVLFGAGAVNASGLQASIKVDEAYVTHMYRQFERFLNAYLKSKTGRFRFKVVFPDLTIFNKDEKFEKYLKAGQFGFSKTLVSLAMGINAEDMQNLLSYENSINLVEKYLLPLQSSHVQNGDDEGGAPKSAAADVGDAGEKTRDLDGNAR